MLNNRRFYIPLSSVGHILKSQLAVLLVLFTSACVSSAHTQTPKELFIDGEGFSLSLVDAYGRARFNRKEYCPPVSDLYVLDQFVRDVLISRQFKTELHTKIKNDLEKDSKPLLDRKNGLITFLKKHNSDSKVAKVYNKQIKRIDAELELLNTESRTKLDRTQSYSGSSSSNDRVETLENVSDAEKQYLIHMNSMGELYKRALLESISDELTRKKYEKLVEDKDERLVNVYFFQYRTAFVVSDDLLKLANITAFLKDESTEYRYRPRRNADAQVKYPANMLMSAYSMDDVPKWTKFRPFFDSSIKDPHSIEVGSTVVSEPLHRDTYTDYDVVQVTYIHDKKFYPVIGLNEKTPGQRKYEESFIRKEVYDDLLEERIANLRANSIVTLNGEIIKQQETYTVCPQK